MIASHAFKLRCYKTSVRLLQSFDVGAPWNADADRSFDAPNVAINGGVRLPTE